MVYWDDEDAVSVVSAKSVKDAVVGETREISIKKKSYKGKVQAMGKLQHFS